MEKEDVGAQGSRRSRAAVVSRGMTESTAECGFTVWQPESVVRVALLGRTQSRGNELEQGLDIINAHRLTPWLPVPPAMSHLVQVPQLSKWP